MKAHRNLSLRHFPVEAFQSKSFYTFYLLQIAECYFLKAYDNHDNEDHANNDNDKEFGDAIVELPLTPDTLVMVYDNKDTLFRCYDIVVDMPCSFRPEGQGSRDGVIELRLDAQKYSVRVQSIGEFLNQTKSGDSVYDPEYPNGGVIENKIYVHNPLQFSGDNFILPQHSGDVTTPLDAMCVKFLMCFWLLDLGLPASKLMKPKWIENYFEKALRFAHSELWRLGPKHQEVSWELYFSVLLHNQLQNCDAWKTEPEEWQQSGKFNPQGAIELDTIVATMLHTYELMREEHAARGKILRGYVLFLHPPIQQFKFDRDNHDGTVEFLSHAIPEEVYERAITDHSSVEVWGDVTLWSFEQGAPFLLRTYVLLANNQEAGAFLDDKFFQKVIPALASCNLWPYEGKIFIPPFPNILRAVAQNAKSLANNFCRAFFVSDADPSVVPEETETPATLSYEEITGLLVEEKRTLASSFDCFRDKDCKWIGIERLHANMEPCRAGFMMPDGTVVDAGGPPIFLNEEQEELPQIEQGDDSSAEEDDDNNKEEEEVDFVGARVAKDFDDICYFGTVRERFCEGLRFPFNKPTKKKLLYHVVYDDNDCEDLYYRDIKNLLEYYKKVKQYDVKVNKKKKLKAKTDMGLVVAQLAQQEKQCQAKERELRKLSLTIKDREEKRKKAEQLYVNQRKRLKADTEKVENQWRQVENQLKQVENQRKQLEAEAKQIENQRKERQLIQHQETLRQDLHGNQYKNGVPNKILNQIKNNLENLQRENKDLRDSLKVNDCLRDKLEKTTEHKKQLEEFAELQKKFSDAIDGQKKQMDDLRGKIRSLERYNGASIGEGQLVLPTQNAAVNKEFIPADGKLMVLTNAYMSNFAIFKLVPVFPYYAIEAKVKNKKDGREGEVKGYSWDGTQTGKQCYLVGLNDGGTVVKWTSDEFQAEDCVAPITWEDVYSHISTTQDFIEPRFVE